MHARFPLHALLSCAVLCLSLIGSLAGPQAGMAQPRGQIGPDDLATLPPADIVILGEVHDNPAHHRNQATAVAAIRPAALVFEMFGPDQAARATDVPRDDAGAMAAALGWEGGGWSDFALYHPILAAAPGAAIYGAALPRDMVRRAMTDGAAAVFGDNAAVYGLDQPLPPDLQAAREAEQQAAHCNALPEAMLPGMVAAQALRDAAFSRTALTALAETGGPVVVIAGSGHADRDRGMPAFLTRAAPDVTLLSLGQVEAPAAALQPYDLWIVTDAAPRDDPCAAFQPPAAPQQGG
ncbi:ChaN family lipoprotein [Tabrizicola sp. DMG-N-6]|uniref:ChaN family lipoprotein n=2 Tax=Szabonella alba TaxID=2804194 RepID=A0A8K0VA26_9RHOB|nr:ChaN family lipoprotein [Szabonella alba]